MPKFYWAVRVWLKRLSGRLKDRCRLFKLVMLSLFYNSFVDIYYVGDTAMEPLFWFVDHFTRYFGPIFVVSVCVLTASMVIVAYVVGLPYWWNRNPVVLLILFVVGNWLLINIVFHYYMAVRISPGHPPEGILIPEAVSICKKCIAPKPPRTHHCSICNKCILKMDHHCPWLNNCVGHYNHRHFFMYCVYMVAGTLFLGSFGFDIVWDHCWNHKGNETVANLSIKCETATCEKELAELKGVLDKIDELHNDKALPWRNESWYHGVLMYSMLLCLGVLVALGSLTVWHAKLIGRGETSIEAHINKAETQRLKKEDKEFVNPYNFGKRQNWRLFLGLYNGRTWKRHVLLPSAHAPLGNGLQWSTVHDEPF